MAAVEVKNIILKSYDGKVLEIDELIAIELQMLKNIIEDDCSDTVIRLPNINSKILTKVIEYYVKHIEAVLKLQLVDDDNENEDLKAWDVEYIQVDPATLYDLIWAANYMNIKRLLDLTCRTATDIIKRKTSEEICKTFNIEKDFIPKVEQNIPKENQREFE